MLEKLVGLEKVSILQCEEMAKRIGYDTMEFDLCGPKGKKPAIWIDAYLGLLQIKGNEKMIMTRQLMFVQDLWCENLRLPEKYEQTGRTISMKEREEETGDTRK